MKVVKHILFDLDFKDWKHVFWLFVDMIKQFILLDYHDAHESYCLIKFHLKYHNERIEG